MNTDAIKLDTFCSACAERGYAEREFARGDWNVRMLMRLDRPGLAFCPRCGHEVLLADAWGEAEAAWAERELRRQRRRAKRT